MKLIEFILSLFSKKPAAVPDIGDGMLSKHFSKAEFACNHCGKLHPSGVMPPKELLDVLDDLRDHFGVPVTVNSGYRCPVHNANVGGATASRHMEGDASDVMVKGVPPSEVFAYLEPIIGNRGGAHEYNTFTHVDVRGHKARW